MLVFYKQWPITCFGSKNTQVQVRTPYQASYMQHNKILPQPNILPDSYGGALNIIEHFLFQPLLYDTTLYTKLL